MVLGASDHCLQSDVIFVIEGTAVNGAYINDLKTNYIIPSLEYFSQGNIEEGGYVFEDSNTYYGIVVYQAADCLPHPSSDTVGPFTSASKLLGAIDKLELIGGKAESHANIAEGLATALQCFEELQQKREGAPPGTPVHRHCILVCHSPPYLLPVRETHAYMGKTAEQLAQILHEKNINLSIISPRKIPSLYKLFEKAGGDLNASQTKNYAKDPRHLVILKGFSLKERPVSPPAGGNVGPPSLPVTSLPSPLAADSPQQGAPAAPPGVGQSPVYRPPVSQDPTGYMGGMNQLQNPLPQGMGMVRSGAMMGAAGQLQGMPQMPTASGAPPGYHSGAMQGRQPPGRWPMAPPQPRPPYMQPGPSQPTPPQGSALIAQLTQPPSSMPSVASGTGAPQPQPTGMGQYPPQQGPQQTLGGPLSQQQPLKVPMMPGQGQPGNQQQGMQVPVPSGAQQPSQQAVAPSQAVQQPAQGQPQAGQAPGQQQGMMGRERHTIWQGLLEWIEKPKNAAEQQKITKHVPCQVSANSKDGEPELKADNWPSKLIMQLMPKQLIGNIGGAYLKNSKSVLFHPQPCEALDSLTKVMSSGFAGCVHFTSIPNPAACDIKVLILLYTSEKRAYLGFIPNEQAQFVDRLRKVIQQQKSTQIMRQGGQPSGPTPPVSGGSPGQLTMPGNPAVQQPGPASQQPPPQQQPQQGMMMTTSNPLSMGGGQVVASQPGGPRIHMQQGGLVQPAPQQSMQPRGGPLENQLQAERQHNLEKINQLKQTLEAAQQKEQQYMSQLERINHLKSSHLQDALHSMAQQQQRMGAAGVQPGPPQQQQPGQARMMRPVMANNPGLRHLLQQQPQYRQQLMGMGPRPPQMAPPPQQQQQQQGYDDVSNFDFM